MGAPDAAGQAMNVACGERISLNQVIAELRQILDREIEPQYEPERPGDIKHSLASIALAEELLGYRPTVSFREGLSKTAESFVAQTGREALAGP
jgi:UDP-glucose 4-epimerase